MSGRVSWPIEKLVRLGAPRSALSNAPCPMLGVHSSMHVRSFGHATLLIASSTFLLTAPPVTSRVDTLLLHRESTVATCSGRNDKAPLLERWSCTSHSRAGSSHLVSRNKPEPLSH